jgi:hypothetical protein
MGQEPKISITAAYNGSDGIRASLMIYTYGNRMVLRATMQVMGFIQMGRPYYNFVRQRHQLATKAILD